MVEVSPDPSRPIGESCSVFATDIAVLQVHSCVAVEELSYEAMVVDYLRYSAGEYRCKKVSLISLVHTNMSWHAVGGVTPQMAIYTTLPLIVGKVHDRPRMRDADTSNNMNGHDGKGISYDRTFNHHIVARITPFLIFLQSACSAYASLHIKFPPNRPVVWGLTLWIV